VPQHELHHCERYHDLRLFLAMEMDESTYWLWLAAQASVMSWGGNCSAEYAELAKYYREQAEKARLAPPAVE
jgi:hypothetical protein